MSVQPMNHEMDPPAPPDLKKHHKDLKKLRKSISREPAIDYSYNLERNAELEGINLGPIDAEEIQKEEDLLEQERIRALHSVAREHQDQQIELLNSENATRKNLEHEYWKRRQQVVRLQEIAASKHQMRQVKISKVFRNNEEKLKYAVKKRQGKLTVEINDSEDADLIYGGGERTYQVSWKGRPQPIEMRIDQCRDVKDKLGKGNYSLRVFVKERIGGQILVYEKADNEVQNNITDELYHDGKSTSRLLKFETTLIVLAPSELELEPTMVFCFQILDRYGNLCAEGYFPVANDRLDIVEGKYKVPLVRGSVRNNIDKFQALEDMYRNNIDEWFCNLYFQCKKQKKLLRGETELTLHLMNTDQYKEESLFEGMELGNYDELVTSEQYAEHKYSISERNLLLSPHQRWKYMIAEIQIELGLRSRRSLSILVNLLVFLLLIWLSRYVHYSGEWIFLKAVQVPVTNFDPTYFTLNLDFPESLTLGDEIGVVITGILFCLVWFLIASIFALISAATIGKFPEFLYRFTQTWGMIVVLDPFITLIENIIVGFVYDDWNGDTLRLYNYFDVREGNGIIGALMTVFLYAGIIGLTLFAFYNYFIYVHMNRRLLDIYHRITGKEEVFFTPNDSEVSDRYLQWTCYKAKHYENSSGDSRHVAVFDYEYVDDYDPTLNGTASHTVIYNVANDRSRVLYRQFLRLPSGAICELSHLESSTNSNSIRQVLR